MVPVPLPDLPRAPVTRPTLTQALVALAALALAALAVATGARGCAPPDAPARDPGAVVLDSALAAEVEREGRTRDAAVAEADRLGRVVDSLNADFARRWAALDRRFSADSLRSTLHALPPDSLARRLDRTCARRGAC